MTNPMNVSTALESRVCGAKTRNGGTCKNAPPPGATRCRFHGGATPRSKQAAARRILTAQINGILVERGYEPVTDPISAMAEVAGEAVAFKELAREELNSLESMTLTIGAMRTDEGDSPRLMAIAEQSRAAVATYSKALKDAFDMLHAMGRLGLDAEKLRQALQREAERPTREQVAFMLDAMVEAGINAEDVKRLADVLAKRGVA